MEQSYRRPGGRFPVAAGRHGIPERGLAIVLEEGREHPLNRRAVGMVFPFREDEAPCCIVCGL
jgi:hypothetical protein